MVALWVREGPGLKACHFCALFRGLKAPAPSVEELSGVGLAAVGLVAEAGDGDVFVECFPVEAAGAEDDLLALLGSALEKAGKPCQRHSEDAAVAQVYPEAVFVEADSGWADFSPSAAKAVFFILILWHG